MFRDIEKKFKLVLEATDKISDKEAEMDFEDLDDTDIDNDGDTDKSDKYLHKKLGMVAKMDEANDLGVEEPHYVEISVRDAKKAENIINDFPLLKNAIRRNIIVTYGSNVYATENETMFRLLMDMLNYEKIEIVSGTKVEDDPQYTWRESSTSGNVAGYDTPNAFGKVSDKDVEVLGYKKVPKKDMRESSKSTYRKMMDEMYSINEVSYRTYKKDESATPVQKVNKGIQEVNRMIAEMENIVNLNLRLKNESDMNSSQFWKSTSKRFTKINERLIRISNKLKELSK